jgi:site-specific recombinase XerD
MEKIIEIVKEKRPHLNANSIKTYKSILKNTYDKCFDDKEYDLDNFNKDEIILKHLIDMPYNKRKTILASLSVLTENKNYSALMMKDINEFNKNEMKQEKTDLQEENMIEPESVEKIFNILGDHAKIILKKEKLTQGDINEVMKWVMLALTGGIFQAPRRSIDFGNMKWRNYDSEKDNYVDIKNGKFVFQNYKTAKQYERQENEISKPLKNILNKWFKVADSDYVLFDNKKQPLTSPQMTHRLNEIFGRKISTSMLRHIYATKKFGHVNLKDLAETATEMGNSPLQLLKYVKH